MVCTVLVKCREPSDGTRPRTQQQPASGGEELRVVRVAGAGHHFTPDIVFTVLRW